MTLADAGFFGVAVQILRLDVYDPAEGVMASEDTDAVDTRDSRYATTNSAAASAIPSVAAGTATGAAESLSSHALSSDSSATGKLTNAITRAAREEGIVRL